MTIRNRWAVAGLGVSALALAILLIGAKSVRASPGPSDVNVVNPVLQVVAAQKAGQSFLVVQPPGGVFTVAAAPRQTIRQYLESATGLVVHSFTNTSTDMAVIEQVFLTSEQSTVTAYVSPSIAANEFYTFVGTSAAGLYRENQSTLIFVPPGSTLDLGSVNALGVVTGHYEPMP
jgi:hypothetical protein